MFGSTTLCTPAILRLNLKHPSQTHIVCYVLVSQKLQEESLQNPLPTNNLKKSELDLFTMNSSGSFKGGSNSMGSLVQFRISMQDFVGWVDRNRPWPFGPVFIKDNTKPNRSVWNFWGMKDWKCPWLNDECQNQCIFKGIGDVHWASHDNLRVVFQGTWAIGLQELAFCASPRNVDIPRSTHPAA